MNIIEALEDPRFFKPWLTGFDLSAWKIYLKALFNLPLENPREKKLYRECVGMSFSKRKKEDIRDQTQESFVIAGRRSGKSTIAAILAVYLAAFKDHSAYLRPGQIGHIFIIAVDRDQAKNIKNYISGILNSTPAFRALIKPGGDLTEGVRLKNNVQISVKTCNFRSIRGYTILAGILDELAFWRSEESANPDKEVVRALQPALATVPGSLLIGLSTAYNRRGVLFEAHKRYFGRSEGPGIWAADSLTMNPTLSKKMIQKRLEEDPESARTEWGRAIFRSDLEGFLSLETLDAATIPGRIMLPRIKKYSYTGFVDPSGGRADSFTLGISHQEKNQIILDLLQERRPPFSPSVVVKEYCDILKEYKIQKVIGDKYAAEFVVELFTKNGIIYKASELTKSQIYSNFLPLISSGQVELLDNKKMAAQFNNLERRHTSTREIIDHAPYSHDDLANAAAGALVHSHKLNKSGPRIRSLGTGRRNNPDTQWEKWDRFEETFR